MNLDELIRELKSIKRPYAWCEGGDLNETVVITAEGLYEKLSPYSEYVQGPYRLSMRDYEALQSGDHDYIPLDNYIDPEKAYEMVAAGCKPDIDYYQWVPETDIDDGYHERDEIVDSLGTMFVATHDPLPWDEVAEEYLLFYHQIVKMHVS